MQFITTPIAIFISAPSDASRALVDGATERSPESCVPDTESGNIQVAVGALRTAPDSQSRIRPSAPRKPSRRAAPVHRRYFGRAKLIRRTNQFFLSSPKFPLALPRQRIGISP